MIDVVVEAIRAKFKADYSFSKALSGGLHFQQADEFVTLPYGVFYFSGLTQEEIMGTAYKNITQVDIQFNLFSNAEDAGEKISDLTEQLTDCFHWQTLNISGWSCIKFQRENLLAMTFVDDVWQSSSDYALWMEKE